MKFFTEALRTSTHQCSKNHRCAEKPGQCSCRMDSRPIGGVLFVAAPSNLCCHYRMSFGHGNVCNCPARLAIAQELGI